MKRSGSHLKTGSLRRKYTTKRRKKKRNGTAAIRKVRRKK